MVTGYEGKCWRCGAALEDPIGFRSLCDACGVGLHACLGCVHHAPGRANECEIPDTDPILDRGASNFCEWFKPHHRGPKAKGNAAEASRHLFGDDPLPKPKSIDDLFG